MPNHVIVTFDLTGTKDYTKIYELLDVLGLTTQVGSTTRYGTTKNPHTAAAIRNFLVDACAKQQIPLAVLYVGIVGDAAAYP